MKGFVYVLSVCFVAFFCCCFYLIGQQNGELAAIKNSGHPNGSVRTTQYSEQQGTQTAEHKEAKPAEDKPLQASSDKVTKETQLEEQESDIKSTLCTLLRIVMLMVFWLFVLSL